jgi:large subunit ribosomal protein L17
MRHRKKGRKLGRDKDKREALLSNLVKSLFFYEEITTTEAKAKETARWAEKIITLAKVDSVHRRRGVFRVIRDKKVIKKLFDVVAPRYKNRSGGYTKIIRLRYRQGDNALICKVKLV